MNMITYFNELVTKNFNNYLKKYFNNMNYTDKCGNFINYYNFMNDLDSFNDSFMKDVIKGYFEYIDECFFHSYYRKKYCKSNGFYKRKNYVTLFGGISFKRRYYFDNNTREYFFFTDLFLGLPKIKQIDKLKINANKIIFPTDTKTNKYLNIFYNTGLNPFDYVQKETSYL